MQGKTLKTIPPFESEAEEQEFWSTHDSVEYVDWNKTRRLRLPNLKPTTRTVSIRFPETMLEDLKVLANRRDVPYQSLLKVFVAERIEEELRLIRAKGTS